jgi:hypothetical protein
MKRIIIKYIFLSYFFIIVNSLFAQPFDMILTGEDILDDIRFLSLESGKMFLSFSPPLAPAEVKNFLDSIDESLLSPYAQEIYYRVLNRLTPKEKLSFSHNIFTVMLNLNLTLEGNVNFNSDISLFPLDSTNTQFFSVPIRFFFHDFVQLYIEPSKTKNPDETGSTNIPFNYDIEYLPIRSFGAVGGSWWNFQIGRDKLFWGTSHIGSLTFSDKSTLYDFARLSLFSTSVKYSFIVNQLPIKLDNSLFSDPDLDWSAPGNLTRTTERFYYLHRIDFSIKNKLNIGIMEGVMVGNSSLEIKYLNPLIIFHSLFSWLDYDEWAPSTDTKYRKGSMTGSFLSLELNWNVYKSLTFYSQIVMNEFSMPDEMIDMENPLSPNGLGYLAGLHFTRSFNNWGSIFYLEFIYTDPYLYILSSPFASFIQQDLYTCGGIDYIRNKLLGYSRDTVTLSAGADFFNKDKLKFSGSFSWISGGEHNKYGLKWDWETSKKAWNERTPSGIAENKFILCFEAKWKPLPYLILKTNITGILSFNNNNDSGVNEKGGLLSFSAGFHY